ncbi:hypothetical protein [Nitrosomonas sp. Nm33]|uniref:hypothetical protein n=1 Tax=Nitrosomonas sp. Nm33 TaxID=133724 RepID=UPI00089C65B3|nr:hypothetical protein [Nitrosomonas sp. Nm33]SDZ06263.1 hypothetical protein SAMN05421755_10976 [Nitrosomonas sp. Nm33]
MRKRYGWKYGMPVYAVALFVAYSRVEPEQHHAHDVVAGAAIGNFEQLPFHYPIQRLAGGNRG